MTKNQTLISSPYHQVRQAPHHSFNTSNPIKMSYLLTASPYPYAKLASPMSLKVDTRIADELESMELDRLRTWNRSRAATPTWSRSTTPILEGDGVPRLSEVTCTIDTRLRPPTTLRIDTKAAEQLKTTESRSARAKNCTLPSAICSAECRSPYLGTPASKLKRYVWLSSTHIFLCR